MLTVNAAWAPTTAQPATLVVLLLELDIKNVARALTVLAFLDLIAVLLLMPVVIILEHQALVALVQIIAPAALAALVQTIALTTLHVQPLLITQVHGYGLLTSLSQ